MSWNQANKNASQKTGYGFLLCMQWGLLTIFIQDFIHFAHAQWSSPLTYVYNKLFYVTVQHGKLLTYKVR